MEVFNSEPDQRPLSTPQEALASLKLPEGFKATLFAHEPDVQNPISMTFDERGRLWVAENYTYAESSVNFETKLRDRIVILEDTDSDGKHDKRTVFWDQGMRLTSVEVGFGGVFALCAPHLLFIPDKNRDDVPDGEPQILLDGWDASAVRHNIVNGLKWGPDGWLYGRHGILATSSVGPPGSAPSQRKQINCGIWRYHPTRKTFDVVCHGTTNPWGFDFDENGQMFFSNTVIGHLWHVIPGAHYERMYGADMNPHVYELMPQIADHYHFDKGKEVWSDVRKGVSKTTDAAGGGHAHCGLMIYLGDNWPQEYRGDFFTINLHGRRLNRDKPRRVGFEPISAKRPDLTRRVRGGAGYVLEHGKDLCFFGDEWFRGIDLIYGPDGGVYIADWTDIGECHENDGVHRTSGRIFKVVYGEPRKIAPFDLAKKNNVELAREATFGREWYVRQARRLLAERAANGQDLTDAYRSLSRRRIGGVREVLASYAMGKLTPADLARLASQGNYWGIRLLADEPVITARLKGFLLGPPKPQLGFNDLAYASLLQRLPLEDRWKLLAKIHTGQDRSLDLLCWYGIEPAVADNPQHAIDVIKGQLRSSFVLPRLVSRRIAEMIEEKPSGMEALLAHAGELDVLCPEILGGIDDGLRGWRRAPKPANWDEVSARLLKSDREEIKTLATKLGVLFGDGRAVAEVRKLVDDDQIDAASRISALKTLVTDKGDDLLPLLKRLSGDRLLAEVAIRGLAGYSDADIPVLLVGHYPRLRPEAQAAAIDTLVSRPEFAAALLAAVEAGKLAARDISAFHARQIRSFENAKLSAKLASVWGEVRASAADKQKLMAEWKEKLTPTIGQADLSAGRALFAKSCANCHVLYGEGKSAGPDLTGGNRRNLDYLLENLLDPSGLVAADFRMTVFQLRDGQTISGVIVEQTEKTLTIQTQQERVTIPKSDVERKRPSNLSLMPDGLLTPLSPEQVRDLVGYLMTREQVPLPTSR
ncbi:MAG TPA: PVC-type heme-binding CxxCH protein [Pirellulaceae bacterium]|nr:PVC-type heme-binding CxxCH protein [Pirellulaceae bacterium]